VISDLFDHHTPVLDRLVHTAHRLALDGETLRKPAEKSGKRSKLDTDNAA
jgi:hypothetical protein